MPKKRKPIVIRFIGPSGCGKTTLIEKLVRELKKKGLAVAAIKHAHHGFTIDKPGKDSYRFRCAGAKAVAIASPAQTALIYDSRDATMPIDLVCSVVKDLDLILVEGFSKAKGWFFCLEDGKADKPVKKERGYLGSITRAESNKPADIAGRLIKQFKLRP